MALLKLCEVKSTPDDANGECRRDRHFQEGDQHDGDQRGDHSQTAAHTGELLCGLCVVHGSGECKLDAVALELHDDHDEGGDGSRCHQVDLKALNVGDVQREDACKALPVCNVAGKAGGECHQEDAGCACSGHTDRDEDGQHDGAYHDDGAQTAQGGEQDGGGHNHDQGDYQRTVAAQLSALFDDVLSDAGLVHQLTQPCTKDGCHDGAAHTDGAGFKHSGQPADLCAVRVFAEHRHTGDDADDDSHQRKRQQSRDLLGHHQCRDDQECHNDQNAL